MDFKVNATPLIEAFAGALPSCSWPSSMHYTYLNVFGFPPPSSLCRPCAVQCPLPLPRPPHMLQQSGALGLLHPNAVQWMDVPGCRPLGFTHQLHCAHPCANPCAGSVWTHCCLLLRRTLRQWRLLAPPTTLSNQQSAMLHR